jgi:UV DNA damage endonuclease
MPSKPVQHEPIQPNLGLVCITVSNEVRYRTITRKRLLSFPLHEQSELLGELYLHNIGTLWRAIDYCSERNIRLYRISSQIFPFADEPVGIEMLGRLQDELREAGKLANARGLRLVIHPDQFVVLNSESPQVVQNSLKILAMHARTLDYLEQPHSPWSPLEVHGGKGKRSQELIAAIGDLPPNIRTRLALENDEYIYSAAQILEICRAAEVPMVFDAHHHVCHEKIESYDDPSIARFVEAAATTWPKAEWQLAHISNGREFFTDRRHNELIIEMPPAYRHIPWIEVEAKGKELAIEKLQQGWLAELLGRPPVGS